MRRMRHTSPRFRDASFAGMSTGVVGTSYSRGRNELYVSRQYMIHRLRGLSYAVLSRQQGITSFRTNLTSTSKPAEFPRTETGYYLCRT